MESLFDVDYNPEAESFNEDVGAWAVSPQAAVFLAACTVAALYTALRRPCGRRQLRGIRVGAHKPKIN